MRKALPKRCCCYKPARESNRKPRGKLACHAILFSGVPAGLDVTDCREVKRTSRLKFFYASITACRRAANTQCFSSNIINSQNSADTSNIMRRYLEHWNTVTCYIWDKDFHYLCVAKGESSARSHALRMQRLEISH